MLMELALSLFYHNIKADEQIDYIFFGGNNDEKEEKSMLNDLLAAVPVNGRRVKVFQGQEQEWIFPVEQLHTGDVVRVLPGERIPSDGIVVKGCSNITSQPIARISVMEKKNIGDKVLCGTINCDNIIEVKLTAEYSASSLQARIKRLQEQQGSSWWEHVKGVFRIFDGQRV